jgi:4-amino-4-deoxy-L-arabinose transferase-like glycosyltransferase
MDTQSKQHSVLPQRYTTLAHLRGRVLARPALWWVLLLFLLALAPRMLGLGAFLTTDEANHWQLRAHNFLQALQEGDYASTNQTGHPGVTTMWLGAAGTWAYDTLVQQGRVEPIAPALEHMQDADYGAAAAVFHAAGEDVALYHALVKMPVALVGALWVALMYLLLRRLLGEQVALLAALFLAVDPFLVAHTRVLHVDALLTMFMNLSLLALLAAVHAPDEAKHEHADRQPAAMQWGLLLASGVAAGLAFLTKSPSVLLVPMTGLIVLLWAFGPVMRSSAAFRQSVLAALRAALVVLLAWGAVALAIWVVLWPAMWVDPSGTLMSVLDEVRDTGGIAHGWGNFFMGQPVAVPGPLYYPVVLVLRLTPWLLGGLFAAVLAGPWREQDTERRSLIVLLLLVFALLFFLMMSIPPKKFDRYLLPMFPVLNIIAALGWVRLWSRLSGPLRRVAWLRSRLVPWLLVLVLCIWPLLTLVWYHPYYLAYYNPLLGGGPAAARLVYVGWGEGLEQAGRYIEAQPDGCDYPLSSWYEETILPYVCSPVMHPGWAREPGNVGYVVLYVNQMQREIYDDVSTLVRQRGSLVHTVNIHGIDYAYVYQLPQPGEHEIAADFGPAIRLMSYDVDVSAIRETGMLTLVTQWQARAPVEQNVMLFIHLLDEQGDRIAQTDVPPAGPEALPQNWNSGHYYRWFHQVQVGQDIPPGTYWLAVGLYHADTFERLPLQGGPAQPDAPDYGADALLLEPVVIGGE